MDLLSSFFKKNYNIDVSFSKEKTFYRKLYPSKPIYFLRLDKNIKKIFYSEINYFYDICSKHMFCIFYNYEGYEEFFNFYKNENEILFYDSEEKLLKKVKALKMLL